MIVSFDGNIYCGKTTTVAKLKKAFPECEVVDEYHSLESDDYWYKQVAYFSQEIQRNKIINRFDSGKVVLLDRSVLSILAYNWSAFQLGVADARQQCYELLNRLIWNKSVIIPHFFVLLKTDYHSMRKRYIKGERFGSPKKSELLLTSKEFYNCYNTFVEAFFLTLPPNAFLIADPFLESEKIVAYIKAIKINANVADYSNLLLSYLYNIIK